MDVSKTFALAILVWCGAARAEDWFTILGDLSEPNVDTAQLDARSIKKGAAGQKLLFRVSLAEPRTLGTSAFQSYTSIISVQCATRAIFHEYQVRYQGPRWTGQKVSETFEQPRPMAFGGLPEELRQRVLAAACPPVNPRSRQR